VWVQVTATRGASRTVVRSPARDVLQGRHDATGLRVVGPRRPGRALRAVLTDPDPAVGRRTTWTWVLGGRLRLEGRTITVPRRMAGRTAYVVARLTAPGYADQRLRSRTVRLRGR
jgi:hypothetical protein